MERVRNALLFSLLLIFSVGVVAQEKDADPTNSIVRNSGDKDLQWGGCPDFMPNGCKIAVLQGDPAKMNADILFKVPANSDIPNHAHTSAERMILISGEMEVTYEGEKPKKLK